jgi:hypothetical protein
MKTTCGMSISCFSTYFHKLSQDSFLKQLIPYVKTIDFILSLVIKIFIYKHLYDKRFMPLS